MSTLPLNQSTELRIVMVSYILDFPRAQILCLSHFLGLSLISPAAL